MIPDPAKLTILTSQDYLLSTWYPNISFKNTFNFIFNCVYEFSANRGQKRMSDFLKLELQAVANYLLWVLGTEFWSSVRAVCCLNLLIVEIFPTTLGYGALVFFFFLMAELSLS